MFWQLFLGHSNSSVSCKRSEKTAQIRRIPFLIRIESNHETIALFHIHNRLKKKGFPSVSSRFSRNKNPHLSAKIFELQICVIVFNQSDARKISYQSFCCLDTYYDISRPISRKVSRDQRRFDQASVSGYPQRYKSFEILDCPAFN